MPTSTHLSGTQQFPFTQCTDAVPFNVLQCYIVLNIWREKQILISVFLLCDGALTKSIMTKSSCGCPALWVELFECRLPCKGDEGAGDRGGCTCKQKNTTKSHTHANLLGDSGRCIVSMGVFFFQYHRVILLEVIGSWSECSKRKIQTGCRHLSYTHTQHIRKHFHLPLNMTVTFCTYQ